MTYEGTLQDGARWTVAFIRGGWLIGLGWPVVELTHSEGSVLITSSIRSGYKTRDAVAACLRWSDVADAVGALVLEAPPVPCPQGMHPIPDHPGYFASQDGNIWSTRKTSKPQCMRQQCCRSGYPILGLRVDGAGRTRRVSRLVCMAFHGRPPSADHHAAHYDGNPKNNTPDNLRWATPLENSADKARHGTEVRGVAHYKAKLRPQDVIEIRARVEAGEPQARMADEFGVSRPTISSIVNRTTWKHL